MAIKHFSFLVISNEYGEVEFRHGELPAPVEQHFQIESAFEDQVNYNAYVMVLQANTSRFTEFNGEHITWNIHEGTDFIGIEGQYYQRDN